MRTYCLPLIVVLILSSIAAVLANTFWYKLEWVRRPIAVSTTVNSQPNRSTSQAVDDPDPSSAPNPQNQSTPPSRPGFIERTDVLRHLADGSAFFIDAREKDEYAAGHLRGAINLPSSAVYDLIDRVTGIMGIGDRIIVYCGGGECEASHNVADSLRRDFGYRNVLIYEKGWEEIESSEPFADYIAVGETP